MKNLKILISVTTLLLLSSCGKSLEQTAKEKLGTLTEKSKESGLLQKTNEAGKAHLESLFKALGFSYVELK